MPSKKHSNHSAQSTLLEECVYREPMEVREVLLFPTTSYPICPRCNTTIGWEYMQFCNRCGQRLSWKKYKFATVIPISERHHDWFTVIKNHSFIPFICTPYTQHIFAFILIQSNSSPFTPPLNSCTYCAHDTSLIPPERATSYSVAFYICSYLFCNFILYSKQLFVSVEGVIWAV